jgi:hypothetical protein
MHWSVVVLILGLLAIIVYLSLRGPEPEDSAAETEQDDGNERRVVRLALARRKPVTISSLMEDVRAPFPASARPATSSDVTTMQRLAKLEQSLAERERLVAEHEARLAERERELAEREALLLAREKMRAERGK